MFDPSSLALFGSLTLLWLVLWHAIIPWLCCGNFFQGNFGILSSQYQNPPISLPIWIPKSWVQGAIVVVSYGRRGPSRFSNVRKKKTRRLLTAFIFHVSVTSQPWYTNVHNTYHIVMMRATLNLCLFESHHFPTQKRSPQVNSSYEDIHIKWSTRKFEKKTSASNKHPHWNPFSSSFPLFQVSSLSFTCYLFKTPVGWAI